MKRLYYKKVRSFMIVSVAAIILGVLQSWVGGHIFMELCKESHYQPELYDFLNYIFVGMDIGKIPYLSKTDVWLMVQPISFLLFGVIIGGINFLAKPKGYFQYYYVRFDKERQFITILFWENLSWIFSYCILYHITIVIMGIVYAYEVKIWEHILLPVFWGLCLKLLFMMMMKEIMLFCFFKMGMTKAVAIGITGTILLLMINVVFHSKTNNLLLFSNQLSVNGMLFMIIVGMFCWLCNRKINLLKI